MVCKTKVKTVGYIQLCCSSSSLVLVGYTAYILPNVGQLIQASGVTYSPAELAMLLRYIPTVVDYV
jgi:hypothetical protein